MKAGVLVLLAAVPLSLAGQLQAIGQANAPALPPGCVKETAEYRRVGDLGIRADVYHYPDGPARPAVVYLHGGALMMGHRDGGRRVRESALARGYAVVTFDYRLAPQTKLPDIIADVEDGFRWLRREGPKRFNIDPARLAVIGESAGGYLTLVTGFRVDPPPRVLVAYYGYGDLIGAWYSEPSDKPRHNPRKISEAEAWKAVEGPAVANDEQSKGRGTFYQYCRQTGLWPRMVSGWDPRREAEKFFPYMPVKNVGPRYPPTLLVHGTADTDVPFEQSRMMAEEFRKHGVPYQFIEVPNAEHGFAGAPPDEVKNVDTRTWEWVRKHL